MDVTGTGTPLNSFPPLKVSDILECMSELGMPITKAELMEPERHKEKLRQVYLYLVEVCAGKMEEDFAASPALIKTAQTSTAHPDLHKPDSFHELNFFAQLSRLMEICGYYEFSWRDLHLPESKRLRQQLSAVLNLAKFREEQLKVYAELNQPRAVLVQTLDELNEEHMELNKQLESAESESADKSKEMQAVIAECEELEQEIAHNNQLQSTARQEAAALKKQAKDLKDALDTAVWGLEEAEAEEEKLRMKVVSSPDRRQAERVQRRERLDRAKQECEDVDHSVQDAKKKLLKVDKIAKQTKTAMMSLEELRDQSEQHTKLMKRMEDTQSKIQTVQKEAQGHRQATEEVERELHRTEEKIVQERKQQKLEMEAVQEALDQAKTQLLTVEKDRRTGMTRVEAGEDEVRELEAALDAERRQTEQEMEEIVVEYKELEQLYLERDAKRMATIEASS